MPQIFIFWGGFKIRVTNTNEFAQREAFNPGLPVEPGPHCSPFCLAVSTLDWRHLL